MRRKTDRAQAPARPVDLRMRFYARTTRISRASSWLNLKRGCPLIRTSSETLRVPGSSINPVPGTSPKRFISRKGRQDPCLRRC